MLQEDQIDSLLESWQVARERGIHLTPEELCRDNPELQSELLGRIAVLDRFDDLLSETVPSTLEHAKGDTQTLPDNHLPHPIPFSGQPPGMPGPGTGPTGLPVVGQIFGSYRIVAELGHGGMGCVYRATDTVLKRDVALKLMLPVFAARKETHARFLREARALAALRHDNIVEVYQVGEVDGMPFLAMPLLEGETLAVRLAARLKRGKFSPQEVVRIGREIADGLAAAHAKGLIHRDIKPGNIWLEAGTNRVKLLDFGLVRDQDGPSELTGEGAIIGTPAYMSPEQVNGQPLDARSDLFSVGGVLYECATGQRAFLGATQMAVMVAVEKAQPTSVRELNPDIPDALAGLIHDLLQGARDKRPASAAELGQRLRILESGGTVIKHVAPRRLWPWLAAAALVLALAIFGGIAHMQGWFAKAPPVDKVPGLELANHDAKTSPAANPTPEASATNKPGTDVANKVVPPIAPLRVQKIDVLHFVRIGEDDAIKGGIIGDRAFTTTLGDQVTVEAKLSRPAYAYLIAFRPDGKVELCFPDSEDDVPPLTDRPHYPSEDRGVRYGLNEGAGLMAFAVVASDKPLPPFREWVEQNPPKWQHAEGKVGEVWWHDGDLLDTTTSTVRAKGEKALGQATTVSKLNDSLRKFRPGTAVGCIGFVVVKP